MCGIFGILGGADRESLKRMADCIRHRGPDDEGFHLDGQAGLGMVRLSVIDLESGHQPIADETGAHVVVFNGEIYNYRLLRDTLAQAGHRFCTRSDTEVLVHLYEAQKSGSLKALNGDFAFAVWEKQTQRLFIARDRLGVKPLYYAHDGQRFAFSSEMKALLQLPWVSRELDPEAIDAYLTFLYVPAPRTIFRGIRKLPPATALTFEKGKITLEQYWQMPEAVEGTKPDEAFRRELLHRLDEAVRMRLMSDVPLGAFLSGGIDSSCVVALMNRHVSAPVKTFSLGFEKPYASYNELPAARAAATAFRTDHRELIVRPDLAALLPQVVWHMDEPFADSSALLTYLISREAKQHVTVALTGIGGDEVFGGYPRYLGAWGSLYYEAVPAPLRRGVAAMAGWLPESTRSRNITGWGKRFALQGARPRDERYLAWRSAMTVPLKERLYSGALAGRVGRSDASESYRRLLGAAPGHYLDRIAALDLQSYLPDDLLAMGDKMSLAHGLEIRVPFCDHQLVEWVQALPMRERLRGFRLKGLLKQTLRGLLPAELLHRPKQGFMLPLGQWIRGELAPLCRELLAPEAVRRRGWFNPEAVSELLEQHLSGRAVWTHQIYALLVLELWSRRYIDGEGG